VLVVEDEVLIRLTIADALREHGFGVIEASDADEAIGVLQSAARVDIVVTDIEMPGGTDGLALARFVRAGFPHLGLVITSGRRRGDYLQGLADAFFSKPYDLARVVERIRELAARTDAPGPP
jgi:CheY-like chemotaxis protein